ncbi:MAG TPA: ABC transporter permease [Bryobacteraceae bacterium]|jgi:ABC-2 type transport system permease protein|nr:ABC transporter permease [Bryobacteraceae bacterium]
MYRTAHRILLIAKRDYLATIRTKAFIIGLVVAPLLFGGGFLGVALMVSKPDIKERRIAIIDGTGVVAAAVIQAAQEKNAEDLLDKTTHRQMQPRYVFETLQPAADPMSQRLALSERVRREQLFAFIEISPAVLRAGPVSTYSNAGGFDEASRWLSESVNEGVRRVRLARLGVDQSRLSGVFSEVKVDRFGLVSRDPKTGEIHEAGKKNEVAEFAVPFGIMLLLGMIVMIGSSPMLSAVTEDKAQRLVEMLLGLATPFELMAGKVLGALGTSLTSSAFYIVGGTLALSGMGLSGIVPFAVFPWFYIYLIADVTFLCSWAAALGAGCGSPQDAQQLAILLLAPVMIPYFLITFVMQQPNGAISTAMSLFPPFTPMLMLLRQAMPGGGVPVWQPWVGLAGVLAFTAIMVVAAARIFRVAILMQGKTAKFAELVRWAVRG